MSVDLGFIDESIKFLESRFFPSKVGGRPAWLNLKDIPPPEELTCSSCHSEMSFLCQLYSPIDDKDTTFHRTLFIFLCTSNNCFHPNSNANFLVYRSQLPRINSFYPDTPPVEDLNWRPDIVPAKFGYQYEQSSRVVNILPEYGLRIEPEDDENSESEMSCESCDESDDEPSQPIDITDRNSQFRGLCELASLQDDPSVEVFFDKCSKKVQDEVFENFKTCIQAQPEQVIRYERAGKPLWLSKKHVPSEEDIPGCEYCGKSRVFEFQILPQLLNHLNIDQETNYDAGFFDWGTLAIYTCQESCDVGSPYKKEFLWKQDILD